MKKIERRSLLLALAIALVLTGLLLYYLQFRSVDNDQKVTVIVAATNIKSKTVIDETQVKEVLIPQKYVIPGSCSHKKDVVGKATSVNIFVGEQILRQDLVQGREQNGLSAVIPQGYRAITIKVDPVGGVAGQIKTGDFVDVLVYLKLSEGKEVVKAVFQNVEVINGGSEEIVSQGEKYLTLCMKPEDAQKLFLSDTIGKIRLDLRPVTDKDKVSLPDVTAESLGN